MTTPQIFIISKSSLLMRIFRSLLTMLWLGALAARAATNYVVPPGTSGVTPTPAYLSWDTAATNIQEAIDAATNGNTVLVTNGSYCLTNYTTYSGFEIRKPITVKSVNGYSNTLLYVDYPTYTVRCCYMSNGVLDGFTISNGHRIGGSGGGVYVVTGGRVQNCYFVDNYASNATLNDFLGGGVYLSDGIVSNCIFHSNFFAYGGGSGKGVGGTVAVNNNGQVLDCTVRSNCPIPASSSGSILGSGIGVGGSGIIVVSNCFVADHLISGAGYGIYAINASVLIIDCVSSNNYTGLFGNGGTWIRCTSKKNRDGITWNSGAAVFSNCVSLNNSYWGIYVNSSASSVALIDSCVAQSNGWGGVFFDSGGIVRNCLISHNASLYGGVYLKNAANYHRGTSGLFNCTIVKNSSSANDGGGILATGSVNNVVNCIIASNLTAFAGGTHPDIYNASSVNTNNYFNCCCPATNTDIFVPNQGNITSDARFAAASAGNWRLKANSPCVNTGTNVGWMTNSFDLDSRQRIRYGTVDMGAYETIYNGIFITVP